MYLKMNKYDYLEYDIVTLKTRVWIHEILIIIAFGIIWYLTK